MVQNLRFRLFCTLIICWGIVGAPKDVFASDTYSLKIKVSQAPKSKRSNLSYVKSLFQYLSKPSSSKVLSNFPLIGKEKEISLQVGGTKQIELPNNLRMDITLTKVTSERSMELIIAIKTLNNFKSRVKIKPGGTVLVGGPAYNNGVLVVALSHVLHAD